MLFRSHAAFTFSGTDTDLPPPDGPIATGTYDTFAPDDLWVPGDTVQTSVTSFNITADPTLPIKLTYIGSEAGDFNAAAAAAFIVGGTVIFDNQNNSQGDSFVNASLINVSNFFTALDFITDSNSNGVIDFGSDQAFNLSDSDVAIAYANPGVVGDVLQIAFNDTFTGDADYDDIVIQAQVVPLPAAVWMFGAGLAAVGGAAYRRRRGERAARA